MCVWLYVRVNARTQECVRNMSDVYFIRCCIIRIAIWYRQAGRQAGRQAEIFGLKSCAFYIYIYIYIYVCVCLCVFICVCAWCPIGNIRAGSHAFKPQKIRRHSCTACTNNTRTQSTNCLIKIFSITAVAGRHKDKHGILAAAKLV